MLELTIGECNELEQQSRKYIHSPSQIWIAYPRQHNQEESLTSGFTWMQLCICFGKRRRKAV